MNAPIRASDSAPFWDGFAHGELRLPFCTGCGAPHLPAGPVCPYCLSQALDWRNASCRARLSTWVVERKKWFAAFEPPYIVAEVQLAEGPRMPALIGWAHLSRLRAELGGRITFHKAPNGMTLPYFGPEADG